MKMKDNKVNRSRV